MARANATIFPWPPDSADPERSSIGASCGTTFSTVFFHRHGREDHAVCGRVAHFQRGALVAGQGGQVRAVEGDLAGLDPSQAHDCAQQRGLARAVAAHDADGL
ncbi:hypothetical protein G6F32_016356 [Rhizopus arrhizus]|nr:hypothetical protein G6F32_016356 [Rhizopus arrhizus]